MNSSFFALVFLVNCYTIVGFLHHSSNLFQNPSKIAKFDKSKIPFEATRNIMSDAILLPQLLSENAISPDWFESIKSKANVKLAVVKEWQDEEWRNNEGGFQGRDFCHSKTASVRVLDYLIIAPTQSTATLENTEINETDFPKIIGPAFFSAKAESHKGLCHGGSFCALMDDAIGWMGFCVSGEVRPWTGYTVQVNTSLKKSVRVGSTLKLEAWVNRKEGTRKYWITSKLSDPLTGDVHCEAEGLCLLSPEEVKASF